MKTKSFIQLFFAFLIPVFLISCEKDKESYTLENKTVTGDFAYVTTSFIPTAMDTASQQPLAANIEMEGSGILTEMGNLSFKSSFNFDFVTGVGSGFVTTYTGASASDSYSATGSSQRQPDGSILLTETFSNGKGRFEKIKGGGTTVVLISNDLNSGTGSSTWTVTY